MLSIFWIVSNVFVPTTFNACVPIVLIPFPLFCLCFCPSFRHWSSHRPCSNRTRSIWASKHLNWRSAASQQRRGVSICCCRWPKPSSPRSSYMSSLFVAGQKASLFTPHNYYTTWKIVCVLYRVKVLYFTLPIIIWKYKAYLETLVKWGFVD